MLTRGQAGTLYIVRKGRKTRVLGKESRNDPKRFSSCTSEREKVAFVVVDADDLALPLLDLEIAPWNHTITFRLGLGLQLYATRLRRPLEYSSEVPASIWIANKASRLPER